MKNKYKGNILALTIHLMFAKRITGPVMMLFYQAMSLNFSQIGILSSITWLTDASLEMYGGAFSDVYGRKKASLLYATLGMLCMIIFTFGDNFIHFAIASIAYGISLAVGSGNASSLLYDTLRMLKIENQYKKYRGKIMFPAKVMSSIVVLLLPFLYLHNIRYPFIAGFVFYLIAFLTALFFFAEPKLKKDINKTMHKTILSSIREILKSKRVMLVIAIDVLLSGFLLLSLEYLQPIIKLAGLPIAYFGVVYAAVRIFSGLASMLTHKLSRHSNSRLLAFSTGLIIINLIGFALTKSYFLVAFILISSIADGVSDIVTNDITNNNITPKNRTTILSTANLLTSLFFSILLISAGHISDQLGVQRMFGIAGITLVLLSAILLLSFKLRLSKQLFPQI